jgi:hypothetical protein
MRRPILLVMAILLLASCAANTPACVPPEAPVEQLKGSLAYESRPTENRRAEHFTVLKTQNRTFLRHDNRSGQQQLESSRPVYVLETSASIRIFDCPTEPNWVDCVVAWQKENPTVQDLSEPVGAKPCDFSMDVPPWAPSPNNEDKQRVAVRLLQEFREFGYSELSALYARDFNLNDPNIDFYYQLQSGESGVQGCWFDSRSVPHCMGWHLYGQAPVELLKEDVMKTAYRLYPPPIGNSPGQKLGNN